MAILGIEPVVDGLVAKLQADLPAAIDAVNAQVTDGLTVDRGALQVLDHVPHILTLHQWPTIGVAEGPSIAEDDTGFEFTEVDELHVVCYLQDADQQALARRLRRLRLAVVRVCLSGGRVIPSVVPGTNAAWGVTLRRIDPGQTLGEAEAEHVKTWMSSVRVVIGCKSDQVG